jgi:hypothetical protein
MGKLGIELFKKIETPQGLAFISDRCEEMSDEQVIILAQRSLVFEEKAVKALRAFLKAHLTQRAADASPESPLKNKRKVASRR